MNRRARHTPPRVDRDPAAARRQARRSRARGPVRTPNGGGQLHARRLGVPGRRGRRRGAGRPPRGRGVPGLRRAGARGGGRGRGRRRPNSTSGSAGSRPRRSRSASTPASTWRWRRRTRARRPDAAEITEVAWMSPRDALDRNSAGEIELVFPTIKTLETLLPYASSEAALAAAARARRRADPPEGDRHPRGLARRAPRRPGLPGSAAGSSGKGSRPGVPGPGLVGVDAVLLDLAADAGEQPGAGVERRLVLLARALAQRASGSRAGPRRRRSRPRGRSSSPSRGSRARTSRAGPPGRTRWARLRGSAC